MIDLPLFVKKRFDLIDNPFYNFGKYITESRSKIVVYAKTVLLFLILYGGHFFLREILQFRTPSNSAIITTIYYTVIISILTPKYKRTILNFRHTCRLPGVIESVIMTGMSGRRILWGQLFVTYRAYYVRLIMLLPLSILSGFDMISYWTNERGDSLRFGEAILVLTALLVFVIGMQFVNLSETAFKMLNAFNARRGNLVGWSLKFREPTFYYMLLERGIELSVIGGIITGIFMLDLSIAVSLALMLLTSVVLINCINLLFLPYHERAFARKIEGPINE